jgi:hypothetical protein
MRELIASGEDKREPTVPVAGPVEWHKYKDTWVGVITGGRIVCLIDPMEDMPCQAYSAQMLTGIFTTVEDAKREMDRVIAVGLTEEQKSRTPQPSIYKTVLKAALQGLEEAEDRQRQPQITQTTPEAKR